MSDTVDRSGPAAVRATYEARKQRFERERDGLARKANLISSGRLLAFLAAAAGLSVGFWGWHLSAPLWAGLGGLALALFVALVVWHDRMLRRRDRMGLLVEINREALARLERDWLELPEVPVDEEAAADPVARDLDLLPHERSRASLLLLLGTANTPQGRETLVRWLLEPAAPEEVRDRQGAVEELAPELDLRQELELRGRELGRNPPDPEKFLEWAEGEPWLLRRPWLIWSSRVLAAGAIALTVLAAVDVVDLAWPIALGIFNLLFAAITGRQLRDTFDQISGRGESLRHYAGLFGLLSTLRGESDKLRRITEDLTAEGRVVSDQMRRLERLAGLADARHTPLFHLPLMALTLWDFQVLFGFERWQQRVGPRVRGWYAALGEVEALAALAALRHDNPGWTFPRVEPGAEAFRAKGLGHPLLPPDRCVVNDVEVGPAGRFLLVTGSNMSGKSTLLRSIGINAALAQAGGPVFADELELPPLVLGTSFRVQDSIEAGVSFFMAELRRLKQVVDLAVESRAQGERRLLYLLDEILQGTNVYERQVAVRRVILHLLRERAIGAVSTHDLTLAEAEALAEACVPCHFTETYEPEAEGGPRMTFDYQLRDGVATTVNALKLLAMVGLDEA